MATCEWKVTTQESGKTFRYVVRAATAKSAVKEALRSIPAHASVTSVVVKRASCARK